MPHVTVRTEAMAAAACCMQKPLILSRVPNLETVVAVHDVLAAILADIEPLRHSSQSVTGFYAEAAVSATERGLGFLSGVKKAVGKETEKLLSKK